MFKNCSKSVCPTSSIVNEPNPKKVSVLRHLTSEKSTGNSISTQGTNVWLREGGVLPLVCVGPTSNGISTLSKNVKQSVQPAKSSTAPKQRTKPQAMHLSGMNPSVGIDCHTQASLRSIYSKEEKVCERDELPCVVNKENYRNIIVSHFNEQSNTDVYNPDEFSDLKNKASSSSLYAKRSLQASKTPSEKNHYDEKARSEILLSIREELRSWKYDEGLSD